MEDIWRGVAIFGVCAAVAAMVIWGGFSVDMKIATMVCGACLSLIFACGPSQTQNQQEKEK